MIPSHHSFRMPVYLIIKNPVSRKPVFYMIDIALPSKIASPGISRNSRHPGNTSFGEFCLTNNQEQSVKPLPAFLGNGVSFLKRQQRDWKVTVLRTSLDKLAYQMVFPYLSIYIVALGATGTQLGMVNSIGMIIAGLFGPFTGWFIDRIGPKKIYLIGIGFFSPLLSYLRSGAKLGGCHHRHGCLLDGFLHQHPELRDDLRQLPGQPGSSHRNADL
jgi:hypothetical protein